MKDKVVAQDGLRLSVIVKSAEKPKAIVQIVHGMCEHKERYEVFMDYLVEQGYVCVIHDLRGHGESVKCCDDLGYMYDGGWEALIDDVKKINEWIKAQYPDLKCVLFGHSMGSLIVRSYAKRYDDTIDVLFVCGSPSYNPACVIAKWMCKLMMLCGAGHSRQGLIHHLAFDGFNKPFRNEGYKSAWVCSDKDVLEQYHHDSLCQFVFTANGFYNLFSLMQDCYSETGWSMRNLKLPVHFLSGKEDPCKISDKAFYKAVEKMGRRYTTDSHLFEAMRHEVLNETDKHLVWNYITNVFLKNL